MQVGNAQLKSIPDVLTEFFFGKVKTLNILSIWPQTKRKERLNCESTQTQRPINQPPWLEEVNFHKESLLLASTACHETNETEGVKIEEVDIWDILLEFI